MYYVCANIRTSRARFVETDVTFKPYHSKGVLVECMYGYRGLNLLMY